MSLSGLRTGLVGRLSRNPTQYAKCPESGQAGSWREGVGWRLEEGLAGQEGAGLGLGKTITGNVSLAWAWAVLWVVAGGRAALSAHPHLQLGVPVLPAGRFELPRGEAPQGGRQEG